MCFGRLLRSKGHTRAWKRDLKPYRKNFYNTALARHCNSFGNSNNGVVEKKLGERKLIEKACSVDAEEILSLINMTNRETYKDIIPKEYFKVPILTIEELLEILDRMDFYVYKSERKIVGVAALQVENEETGKLNWVYVLPRHQGKGIGTALITHLEQKARKKGLEKIRLRTIEKADQAVNFYKKLGYRLAEKIEVAWGFNLLMEKDL